MDSAIKIIEEKLKKKPSRQHELTYDSSSETLEPLYFWILDFMNNLYGGNVAKITDNFMSSPGSGHFSELNQKKTILQDQVMKTLGAINQVIRAIVNIVYDLKDFEIRLKHYEEAKSQNKSQKEAGMLALKQIWMDNVDIKRGQGSINAMTSGNLQFVTLRDAFMTADSISQVDKIDLNDRVKRILKPRVAEFLEWKKLSEEELKKRFNIEKNYLKSQVNTLQLYSKWIKPYLQSAAELEMSGSEGSPELVTAFNSIVFQLTLMGKRKVDVEQAILNSELPKGIKKPKRKYYSIVLIDFHFRGIPSRAGQQGYAFGGRSNIKFKSYSLNEDELSIFESELDKSERSEIMKLIEGSTTESLDELRKDIDYFIKDDKEKKKEIVDTNPFSALFSIFFTKKGKEKKEKTKVTLIKKLKKDNYPETLVRELAEASAEEDCFTIFDVYKKSHGMPSHDSPYD